MDLVVDRAVGLQGRLRPPSDKSLTHRAYMFAAAAKSQSEIAKPLRSEDCENTLKCLGLLGAAHEEVGSDRKMFPAQAWQQPAKDLFCGNSGTTMRLLSGLIASRPISATLTGDQSLSGRPMRRIAEPLRLMGASVDADHAPLRIKGASLNAIDYRSPVSSAQVKSCVLLAGLKAEGTTIFREPSLSRDHTERMLAALGVDVTMLTGEDESVTRLTPAEGIPGFQFSVPADISSAAFFIVASCLIPRSRLAIEELGVNPTRTGILDVLDRVGVHYDLANCRKELNEPIADLELRPPACLQPFDIAGDLIPRLVDEIPVLAVLASQCEGVSSIRDAAELRVKESDRIELIAKNLRAMGAKVETHADGLTIEGPVALRGALIDAAGDHRIGMAFAIAGLVADGSTTIRNAEAIRTSYPDFEAHLRRACSV